MPSATRNFQQNGVQGKDKLLQSFEGKVAIKISRNCEWRMIKGKYAQLRVLFSRYPLTICY